LKCFPVWFIINVTKYEEYTLCSTSSLLNSFVSNRLTSDQKLCTKLQCGWKYLEALCTLKRSTPSIHGVTYVSETCNSDLKYSCIWFILNYIQRKLYLSAVKYLSYRSVFINFNLCRSANST